MTTVTDGRDYLNTHKVQETIAQGVAKLIRERPADPLKALSSFFSYTFMTIQPTFTVKDWARAKPIMDEFIEATKTEAGCIYYGWSTSGDKLFCREAYDNAESCLAHLANVGALVGKLTEASIASLDEIALHGPEAELDKCKASMDGFGTVYWKTDGGVSWMTKEVGGPAAPQSLVTIQPTFTVKDWAAAEALMKEFVPVTASETGAVYYGWTRQGDKLFCREAYVDAAGAIAHLDNVGALVGKMLDGPASLDKIELHGPAAELEKAKEKFSPLGATFWEVYEGSFQKYV